MQASNIPSLLMAAGLAVAMQPSWAQKAGQSVSVQYGTVTSVRDVDLKSGAVPAGALVGGALGIASGGGKSSGKKARNAIVGAAAGSASPEPHKEVRKGRCIRFRWAPAP